MTNLHAVAASLIVLLFSSASEAETHNPKIAVVGAGPSGLTAAYELKKRGYTNVVVFEKEDRVGGKVFSFRNGGQVAEFGAVLATSQYETVMGYADELNVPYATPPVDHLIMTPEGKHTTFEAYLSEKFTSEEIAEATKNYAYVLQSFPEIYKADLLDLHPDLHLTFDEFAKKYKFEAVADLARGRIVGYGYGFYETAPAIYLLKMLEFMIKVSPEGLQRSVTYMFLNGYMSVWEAVAAQLDDVRTGSEVTKIQRCRFCRDGGVRITVNGTVHTFDKVIVSASLNRVPDFMDGLVERFLFSKVDTKRYVTTLLPASGLIPSEALYFYANTFPESEDQNAVSVWLNIDAESPLFMMYQICRKEATEEEMTQAIKDIVESQGGSVVGDPVLRADWVDYFPHVNTETMSNGFYYFLNGLQGRRNTYYVGGGLNFETVEHSAQNARAMVESFFPAL